MVKKIILVIILFLGFMAISYWLRVGESTNKIPFDQEAFDECIKTRPAPYCISEN